MMTSTTNRMSLAAAAVVACLAVVLPSEAVAQEQLDDFKEVSYLVFNRAAGFDRPVFESQLLDGTVTIRFRRIPAGWRAILAPQIASERKRRFFRDMHPIVERGKLVGIRVELGIGAFSLKSYLKRRPQRWVLRVGETRTPPFTLGPAGVPVVPYADLVEEEIEGRDRLMSAELALAQGRTSRACAVFAKLRELQNELRSWAALREADCLLLDGRYGMAESLLKTVVSAGKAPAAIHLARLRIAESSGLTLSPSFDPDLYAVDGGIHTYVGTVADEINYREARALLFRREAHKALTVIESLLARRPRSPYFEDRTFLHAMRWRAVRDAHQDQAWLLTARTYLQIPPAGPEMPHWVEIHTIGAQALREVGLPKRAVRVYLHLLRTEGDFVLDEPGTILGLAEAYRESGDAYRSRITLKFLVERYPRWTRKPRVIRLRGRLALERTDDRELGAALTDLRAAEPAATSADDARFRLAGAMRTLEIEGLAPARAVVATTQGPVARQLAAPLAMAAGDCDALTRAAAPYELASAEALLWAGACLVSHRRVDEGLVLLEAAAAWSGPELLTPELAPLLRDLTSLARWWSENNERLAAVGVAGPAI